MTPPVRTRMTARSTDEPHRVSTELELLFDLTFVIAIAVLTGRFADALGDGGHGRTSPGSPRRSTPTTCRSA